MSLQTASNRQSCLYKPKYREVQSPLTLQYGRLGEVCALMNSDERLDFAHAYADVSATPGEQNLKHTE